MMTGMKIFIINMRNSNIFIHVTYVAYNQGCLFNTLLSFTILLIKVLLGLVKAECRCLLLLLTDLVYDSVGKSLSFCLFRG
jgi:hypothetical protein